MSEIHTESIGANVVAELLGKKRSKHENNNKIPLWKWHIQTSTAELRQHVEQLQEWNKDKLSKNRVKPDLERKYYVNNEELVQTARTCSNDIGMQLEISKCAMLEMKRGKVVQSKGIVLPNEKMIKSVEDEKGYNYLGVFWFDSVDSKEIKDMITKEHYRRVKSC